MTIALCMRNRPLPEEEELEDQLFAGTSEAEPGNEPYKKKTTRQVKLLW